MAGDPSFEKGKSDGTGDRRQAPFDGAIYIITGAVRVWSAKYSNRVDSAEVGEG